MLQVATLHGWAADLSKASVSAPLRFIFPFVICAARIVYTRMRPPCRGKPNWRLCRRICMWSSQTYARPWFHRSSSPRHRFLLSPRRLRHLHRLRTALPRLCRRRRRRPLYLRRRLLLPASSTTTTSSNTSRTTSTTLCHPHPPTHLPTNPTLSSSHTSLYVPSLSTLTRHPAWASAPCGLPCPPRRLCPVIYAPRLRGGLAPAAADSRAATSVIEPSWWMVHRDRSGRACFVSSRRSARAAPASISF